MENEFVIWGKTNPNEEEKLLVTKFQEKNITDKKIAENVLKTLEKNFGCSECRVQEINLQYPENLNKLFVKTLNK